MFSETVDSIIARSGRQDKKTDIIDYLNATIRECQAVGLFFKDLVENTVPITNNDPLIWVPPRPGFRQLRIVQYPDLSYPELIQPGRKQNNDSIASSASFEMGRTYYYAASNYIVFVRCGTLTSIGANGFSNQFIGVAYYTWLPRLKYYPLGHRPAQYDDDQAQVDQGNNNLNFPGWTFNNLLADTDPSTVNVRKDWTQVVNQPPNGPPNALTFVTNWLLDDWKEMLKEGALAKLFKAVGDQTRSSTAFAVYMEMRKNMVSTELFESINAGGSGGN